MNYILSLLLIFSIGCNSQVGKGVSEKIDFEEGNHFRYNLTSEKYLLLDTQQKMNAVYKIIHAQTTGNRRAPIPTVAEDESYFIFKPVLKNSNDIEIKEILLSDDVVYVEVKEFDNPEVSQSSRISPNVLVRILKKVNPKKIITNYQKNN